MDNSFISIFKVYSLLSRIITFKSVTSLIPFREFWKFIYNILSRPNWPTLGTAAAFSFMCVHGSQLSFV